MTEALVSDRSRYTAIAITLHWLIALSITGLIAVGWNMDGNENLYQLHKSFGITVLVATIVRIVWRLLNPPPPLPERYAGWEKSLSQAVHILFYALMVLMPLTGWLLVSTSYEFDVPTVLFGLIDWPDIPGVQFLANETGHGAIENVHSKLAWVAIGAVILHIVGAMKHEFAGEQGVLQRMLPGLLGETDPPRPARGGFAAFGTALIVFCIIAAMPVIARAGLSSGTGEVANLDAANWAVDADESEIRFSGVHDGNAFSGSFGTWTAAIAFDPEQLERSEVNVVIETGSAKTGTRMYDNSLDDDEWFDVRAFPVANVTISEFSAESGRLGSYTATASLSIKDTRLDLPFRFDLSIDGNEATMTGSAELSRAAFNLGQISDPGADWVSDEIAVDVTVKATRIAPAN